METTHYFEMKELAKKNEVYCFCMQFNEMKNRFVKDGIHYIGVAKASTYELYTEKGTRSIALARRFARALPGALENYSFDLVYANSFPYLHLKAVKAYCKAYCKAYRCRLALDVAEVWDINRWKDYIGKFKGVAAYHYARNALKGAYAYTANSSATAKELEKAGIPKSRITVLSPVIELEKMLKVSKQLRKLPVATYAGRLIKEKRLDLWVESVAEAHMLDHRIKGLIIGSGPEEANVRKLIKKYHFITMRKPYSSKAQLYKAVGSATCMLNMSERERFSIIAIESVALGTIPVLPDYTPIPEEVKTLSIVKSVKDIPKVIASIASERIKYRVERQKLERFDVGCVDEAFENIIIRG